MSTIKVTNLRHESATGDNITLDSSGRVGIGEASPNRQLVINGGASEGVIQITNDTSGTAVANGFELIHFTNGETQLLNRENGAMRFDTNGTERMRILASGGLTFNGDTAAANALDDYEEGSFTVTISGSTSGSGIVAATTQYIKIGRQVTVWMRINGQTFPAYSGDLRCSLPFTSSSADNYSRGPFCYHYPNANWDTQANFVGFYPIVLPGSSQCQFGYKLVDGDWQNAITSANTTTSSTAGLYLEFTLTYYVA